MGGFFTSNLEVNTKVVDYPGWLAEGFVEKGKQAVPHQYWGMHLRAVRFAYQPIKVSDNFIVWLKQLARLAPVVYILQNTVQR